MDLAIYLIVRRAHLRVLGKLRSDLEEKRAPSFALHKQVRTLLYFTVRVCVCMCMCARMLYM